MMETLYSRPLIDSSNQGRGVAMLNKNKIKRVFRDLLHTKSISEPEVTLKSALIEEAAIARNLDVHRLSSNMLEVEINKRTCVFKNMNGPLSSTAIKILCDEKDMARLLLKGKQLSVPLSIKVRISEHEKILGFVNKVGFPIVLKPNNLSQGRGVFTNICDVNSLRIHLKKIADFLGSIQKEILVEKQYIGDDYRYFIVDGEIISITKRARANVMGDGEKAVLALINDKNNKRLNNRYLKDYLIPCKKDKLTRLYRQPGFPENS
jgi:D-alanine-D-alanine ligase-like ATP-grasp enzyme